MLLPRGGDGVNYHRPTMPAPHPRTIRIALAGAALVVGVGAWLTWGRSVRVAYHQAAMQSTWERATALVAPDPRQADLIEQRQRLLVRLAGVQHDRRVSLPAELEHAPEDAALHVAGREVVMVVEADLAECHDL